MLDQNPTGSRRAFIQWPGDRMWEDILFLNSDLYNAGLIVFLLYSDFFFFFLEKIRPIVLQVGITGGYTYYMTIIWRVSHGLATPLSSKPKPQWALPLPY